MWPDNVCGSGGEMWPDNFICEWGRDNVILEYKRYVARQYFVGVGERGGQIILYRTGG